MSQDQYQIILEFDNVIDETKIEGNTLKLSLDHFPVKLKVKKGENVVRKLTLQANTRNREIKFHLT
jgi:hypothetical protein